MEFQVTAVKTALTIRQRICRGTHFAEVGIGTDMQLTNQLQIVIQNLEEGSAFLLCLGINHRQMQADRADIEPPDEHRLVLCIGRLHAAPLKPGGEEGSAAHGADDGTVFLVNLRYIALTCQRKPIGVHALGGAENPCLKDILQFLSCAMQVFVIEEHQLREKNRLFAVLFALPFSADIQHSDGGDFRKFACTGTEGHCDEGVIAAAGRNGIEFIFPALKALIEILLDILHGFSVCDARGQTHIDIAAIIFFVAFFRKWF